MRAQTTVITATAEGARREGEKHFRSFFGNTLWEITDMSASPLIRNSDGSVKNWEVDLTAEVTEVAA